VRCSSPGRASLAGILTTATLLTLVAAVAAGLVAMMAPQADRFPEGSSMARLHRQGVVTVGVKFDQRLFGFKDPSTGRITGFDAELARLIATDLTGSTSGVRFVETVSKNRERFLRDRAVDIVIATYSITPERSQMVAFTSPYFYASQDVLVRRGDRSVQDVADLADTTVCTARGATSGARLRQVVPRVHIAEQDTYSECAWGLEQRQYTGVSTDDTILAGLMGDHPGEFRMLGRPFAAESYGIAVRSGDTLFRNYLEGLLRRYLADGSWDRIYRDTVGTVVTTSPTKIKPGGSQHPAPWTPWTPLPGWTPGAQSRLRTEGSGALGAGDKERTRCLLR
jgi:glutamate transport system substrate-binding protein